MGSAQCEILKSLVSCIPKSLGLLPAQHGDVLPRVSRNDARGSMGRLWNLRKNITVAATRVEHAQALENKDGNSIRPNDITMQ